MLEKFNRIQEIKLYLIGLKRQVVVFPVVELQMNYVQGFF